MRDASRCQDRVCDGVGESDEVARVSEQGRCAQVRSSRSAAGSGQSRAQPHPRRNHERFRGCCLIASKSRPARLSDDC